MNAASRFPAVPLAHKPTALERLENTSATLNVNLWVKRDDCTGLALGGNKVRQLEYYMGQAVSQHAEVVLTTGAVQSNHVRCTVAAARKLGLQVEVQLEERVDTRSVAYRESGNPLLVRLMGATVRHFPVGEDENAADEALYRRAAELEREGKRAYVIPLSNVQTPWGALGYVEAAAELQMQLQALQIDAKAIVVASGSASTHAGLLAGLAAVDSNIPVYGICVRRPAAEQVERVQQKVRAVLEVLEISDHGACKRVVCDDRSFAPGYGKVSARVQQTLLRVAQTEGLLLDPTYTAKAFDGLLQLVEDGTIEPGADVVFVHTGGAPALFGYPELLSD